MKKDSSLLILGSCIGPTGEMDSLAHRIQKSTKKFWDNIVILKNKLTPLAARMLWWNRTTALSLVHGLECLPLRRTFLDRLDAAQMSDYRIMCGSKVFKRLKHEGEVEYFRRKTKSLKNLMRACKIPRVSEILLAKKWSWAGHLARMCKSRGCKVAMMSRSSRFQDLDPERRQYFNVEMNAWQTYHAPERRMAKVKTIQRGGRPILWPSLRRCVMSATG